ncbi:neural/ectodermal development factor IMP-L2, partial [Biomphalaria pfeifferi]
MLTRLQSVAIIVCLVYVPQFTFALSRRLALNKRLSKHEEFLKPKLFFKSKPSETSTVLYDSIVLSCEAAGIPNPTIHWLKNGERVQQGTSHNVQDDEATFENAAGDDLPRLQLANTVSKLYLDCITEEDEAEYTCVAETPLARKTQSHKVFIDPIRGNPRHRCSLHNGEKPARIYMATSSRFEYENELTQLYCRAEGKPTPTITWYDPFNEPITNADGYK